MQSPTTPTDDFEQYLSNDEFDALVADAREPLAKVPAGFPSMHSRYPAVVSRGADASRISLRPESVQAARVMGTEIAVQCREELRGLLRPLPALDFEP